MSEPADRLEREQQQRTQSRIGNDPAFDAAYYHEAEAAVTELIAALRQTDPQ